jgi:hypothetical protein
MSFLRRLLGRDDQSPDRLRATASDRPPGWMRDGMQVQLYDGPADLEVVGESHYQDNLWRLVGGRGFPDERVRVDAVAVLAAETDNPYDANAVAVWVRGLKVGYLSRADAQRYQPGLLALQRKHGMPIALAGVIVGGGMRPDGPGMLGLYAHLEDLLYRSRDAFMSALDEYDETCRQHDVEMDSIRPALVAKWGQVPVLDTYRWRSASRRPRTSSKRSGGPSGVSPSTERMPLVQTQSMT